MAKTKISEFSSTPANNTDIDSINIAEGCAPSGINDAIRELMAQLKDFQTGAQGDSFNGPIGTSTAAAGAFTTLSATGAITSTLATGTAPLVIASTTKVANLNVDLLDGADWASPAALGSTTPAAGSFTTLGASSTATLNTLVSSGATLTGGTINGMTIGATTASTGAFTTLSASSTVTLSGGTANGVAYLNGSKVLTTGSALAFDGSNVTANGSFTSGTTGVAGSFILARSSDGAGTTVLESLAATNNIGLRNTVGSIIFSANNSEGMRLTSTGLGIGTSSPVTRLEVYGAQQDSANTGNIRSIDTGTLGANKGGGVLFGGYYTGTTPTAWAAISGLKNNATDGDYGGYLAFKSRANGGSLAENMRLDSAGNLGLGVTPSAWSTSFSIKAFDISGGSVYSAATDISTVLNAYFNSSNAWIYKTTNPASRYTQGSGQHQWYTAASGTAGNAITFTQAMTLTADGNLLVGTTTSAYKTTAYVSGQDGFCVQNSATGTGTGNGTLFGLDSSSNGVMWSFDAVNLVFGNTNTERARIDSSGNLLVGTTSQIASTRSVIAGSSANAQVIYFNNTRNNGSGDATAISLLGSSDNNTSNYHFIGTTGGTDRVYIFGNGNIQNTNNSYGAISDVKLKENIVDTTPKLADLMQVKVRNYNLIGDTAKQLGVVAQELETVFPSMVEESPDRDAEGNDLGTTTKSVKYSVFVPMLIKALQELKAEFDAYKASHP